MIITRRQFLQLVSASAAAIGLSQTDLLKLEKALASQPATSQPSPSVIWLSGQACSGCPVSLLNRVVDTGGDLGSGYKYYDADMLNALYNTTLPTPGPLGNDRAGVPLDVVTDVADLLVGDAVRALVPGLVRTMLWSDDMSGVLSGSLLDAYAAGFPTGYVTLDWNSTVMAGAGDIPVQHLKDIVHGGGLLGVFILMVDGAVPTKDERYCYVFDNEVNDGVGGTKIINELPLGSITLADALRWMAPLAAAVISVGACASYGGIPHGKGNKTGAMGVKEFLTGEGINTPVINVPGCPPHPDWIIYPAAYILANSTYPPLSLSLPPLDIKGRPTAVFQGTLMNGIAQPFCYDCPNKPTQGTPQAAQTLGDKGCLGYLGCKGPYTVGDCPIRQKNTADDGTKMNWCVGAQGPGAPSGNVGKGIGEARHPCQGCIEPEFPDWAALTGTTSGIKGFYNP
jgi:hydrogenase small subunit